jgi:hypothetical protein
VALVVRFCHKYSTTARHGQVLLATEAVMWCGSCFLDFVEVAVEFAEDAEVVRE